MAAISLDLLATETYFAGVAREAVKPLPLYPFPGRPADFLAEHGAAEIGAVLLNVVSGARVSEGEAESGFALALNFTILHSEFRPSPAPGAPAHGGVYPAIQALITALNDERFTLRWENGDGALVEEPVVVRVESFYFVARREDLWEYALRATVYPRLATLRRPASSFPR